MSLGADQEKTEKATPKKREEARTKGQVAKSREVSSTVVFLSLLLVLYFFGPYFLRQFLMMMHGFLSQTTTTQVTLDNLNLLMMQAAYQIILILAPLFVVGFAAAIFGNVMQFGFLLTGETLTPDFNRLDPIKGLGKLFSKRSLMELVKSILKISVVAYLAFSVVQDQLFDSLLTIGDMDVWGILFYVASISYKILVRFLWFLIVLSILDYAFQKWEYEENLKMTKQEVKDEYKQREGDPHVKARVRSIQRDMARKRMLTEIPKADVVITNPTHYAVALRYSSEKENAPRCTAKGMDYLAQKMRDVAREHQVPVVENKPLAQLLYKTVKLNHVIPDHLFRAVAEVLAYVYSLKQKT
jgi:flagellar biosynthetic protein FlhB